MASKAQKKEKRIARHQRQIQRRLEKKRMILKQSEEGTPEEDEMLEETGEEIPEDIPLDEESEAEEDLAELAIPDEEEKEIHKDMMEDTSMPMPMMDMGGPTSWAEMDAMQEAEDRAQAIREVTYDTSDLVRNILHSMMMDPQAKAAAMKAVADGFEERVNQELADENVQKDLDLLAFEALKAYDDRHMSVWDMIKAKVSYGERKNMPDSNFAVVTSANGKKVRKYLIHDKAHVRNALARAAQAMKMGGTPAKYARMAMSKIHAAAKHMGIGQPSNKERSAILIEKDQKGDWRWVAWVSNNFKDFDGDIITEDAHKEFVAWWEQNKELSPVLLDWHTEGTERKNPVDFITFEKGFLIESGKLTEDEAAVLLKAQTICDLGMSHGMFGVRDRNDKRLIVKYRQYESSVLPLENAANPWTNIETISKEVKMDKQKYLAAILGEEKAKAFMEKTGMKQEVLQTAQVESKEKKDETPEPKPVVAAPIPAPQHSEIDPVVEKVLKEMDIEGLNAFVTEAKEAMEKVPVLEALVKDLQGDVDEKVAEKLTPPAARFAWSQKNRPSQADDNKIEKKDKLAASVPGVPDDYWLSEATGSQPVRMAQ